MTGHALWLIGRGAASWAFLAWASRRFDVNAFSRTPYKPPPEVPWEEPPGGDGPYRYGRAHSFNTALA